MLEYLHICSQKSKQGIGAAHQLHPIDQAQSLMVNPYDP